MFGGITKVAKGGDFSDFSLGFEYIQPDDASSSLSIV